MVSLTIYYLIRPMELHDYLTQFKRYRYTFIFCVLGVVAVTVAYVLIQPERITTILSLHVAREGGAQETQEYQYDGFYRIQADERFADTIVRWLSSPRIVADIYAGVGRNIAMPAEHSLGNVFSARRLSSQYIEVRYTSVTEGIAEKIATSLERVLNERTDALNTGDVNKEGWFRVIVEEPVMYPAHIPWIRVLAGAIIAGVFIGFWAVGVRGSLKENGKGDFQR